MSPRLRSDTGGCRERGWKGVDVVPVSAADRDWEGGVRGTEGGEETAAETAAEQRTESIDRPLAVQI